MPGLFLPVKAYAGLTVGDGTLKLAHNGIVVILQVDAAIGILIRLGHLAGGVLKAMTRAPTLGI